MSRKEGQKRKLLVLLDILARETDEKHPLSVPQLVERLQERGVVLKGGIGMSLKELYDERLPLYEQYAGITVDVNGLSITAAARKVADALAHEGVK